MTFQRKYPDFTIKGAASSDEVRSANDLMAKGHGEYARVLRWLETCGAVYPGYCPEHTRIALWKGEVIGALRISSEVIRLGEARLRTGGIDWMTTAAPYRGRGVCRALMMDVLDYLRRQNHHVAMLFGNPRLFQRFGFTTTLSTYSITIDAGDVLTVHRAPHRLRQAKPGDIPALQRIHNANDEGVACSLIRTCAHITNKWERCKTVHVLASVQGKILGYLDMQREGDELIVYEAGVGDLHHYARILSECGRLATEDLISQIRFLIPPAHPLTRFLLSYQSAQQTCGDEIYAPGCGRDGLMAFVNLEETLENLIPEWEELLSRSALRNARVETSLRIDNTSVLIRANRGSIGILSTPGRGRIAIGAMDFLHMLTGYRSADDILSAPRRLLLPEERLLLDTLFPRRDPYVWPFDRF